MANADNQNNFYIGFFAIFFSLKRYVGNIGNFIVNDILYNVMRNCFTVKIKSNIFSFKARKKKWESDDFEMKEGGKISYIYEYI